MKKVHFPNLDAWRFIAFFSVFLFHSLYSVNPSVTGNTGYQFLKWLFSEGNLGVNFFFVLSGFLITYLLLVEESTAGKYKIKDFWMRRILRIWPLYFAVLIYSFIIFRFIYTVLSGKPYHESANPVYYVFFLSNFNLIQNGYPLENCLTVLWSVAVEEQFYLLWPLLFFIRRTRMWVIAAIIIGSVVFRYYHAAETMTIRHHTFSVMGNLAFGCLLACISFRNKLEVKSININKGLNLLIYLVGFAGVFCYTKYGAGSLLVAFQPIVVSAFFAYIVFEQVFVANSLFDLGRIKLLDYWGKYTYGLYCLHTIGIFLAYNVTKILKLQGQVFWVVFGETSIALFISMAMAWVSYTYLEKPFLLLKNKFAVVFNR